MAELKPEASPHRAWYDLIEENRLRDPTFGDDNWHILATKAEQFDSLLGDDDYAAGIWHGDLHIGLLWHDLEFETCPSSGTLEPFKKPTVSRSPSWTWTSLDGPVRFLRQGSYDIQPLSPPLVRDLHVYTAASDSRFGRVRMQNGVVSLTGQMRQLEELRGFNADFASWMRSKRSQLGFDCTPDISMDPDFVFDCDKYVLPLVRKRCDSRCRHSTGCDADQMAYGLILHFVGQGPRYDNLLGMVVAQAQSGGKVKPYTEVFMRCGVAAFYMSSFEQAPWQDAVIV